MTIMNQPITETFTEDEMINVIVALETTINVLNATERIRALTLEEIDAKKETGELLARLKTKHV